jgi:hypothetical protein
MSRIKSELVECTLTCLQGACVSLGLYFVGLILLVILSGCASACPDGPPSLCVVPASYYTSHQRYLPAPPPPTLRAPVNHRPELRDIDKQKPNPDIPGQVQWMKERLESR